MLNSLTASVEDPVKWNTAVSEYNHAVNNNARAHVANMSDDDLLRYCKKHNTPSPDRHDVLRHMIEWGGFRGLLMSGGVSKNNSQLFLRLLGGKPAIPTLPPRSFGKTWYELFDEPNSVFECAVKFGGKGRRKRDIGNSVFLINVNDGLWQCNHGTDAAMALLDLCELWVKSDSAQRTGLWSRALELLQQDIKLSLNFGSLDTPYSLWLESSSDAAESITYLQRLNSDAFVDPLAWTRFDSDCPFTWNLSNSTLA